MRKHSLNISGSDEYLTLCIKTGEEIKMTLIRVNTARTKFENISFSFIGKSGETSFSQFKQNPKMKKLLKFIMFLN